MEGEGRGSGRGRSRERIEYDNKGRDERAGLIDSLNAIITTFEIHGTEADSRIASAAAQNSDAQAQPVSSQQWARIALDTAGYDVEQVGKLSSADGAAVLEKLGSMLSKYNERPEVIATTDNLSKPASKRRFGGQQIDHEKTYHTTGCLFTNGLV